jgi:hypothetical protein
MNTDGQKLISVDEYWKIWWDRKKSIHSTLLASGDSHGFIARLFAEDYLKLVGEK